ncbi:MAG: hypothetical protein WC365_01060 [Candidatus Babeliales bacterium]
MVRVQRAICNVCGMEHPTEKTIYVDGLQARVGNGVNKSYLRETDYCSINCLMKALDETARKIRKEMNNNG